jgi:antitoxin CcdA
MKSATANSEARKRPVNLTLNEDLVIEVRGLTNNLSGVVESLLVDYVEHKRQQRISNAKVLDETISMWNAFNGKSGSFADEYSSL